MQGRRGVGLLAAVVLVVQLVCWRGSIRLKAASPRLSNPLLKRAIVEEEISSIAAASALSTASPSPAPSNLCQPLPFQLSPQHLCNHIRLHCPPSGHIDYLQFYYCIGLSESSPTIAPATLLPTLRNEADTKPYRSKKRKHVSTPVPAHLKALRILALVCIIAWMLFLFSWVGVVASDFFCPNLGTIAARLGLSESTAGVTFLAFGNGSPDVFSTFGAMRTGSGSLAIGELIGAASYIVSVISGSMMLIAPFRVKPYPFIRDVGFFFVAVSMTMLFLFDGKLRLAECIGMIGLYLMYAATVIAGSWWQERRRRKNLLMSVSREQFFAASPASRAEGVTPQDMERQSSQHLSLPKTPNHHQQISPIEYDPDIDPFNSWQQRQDSGSAAGSSRASPNHSPLLTGYDLPTSSSNLSSTAFTKFKTMTGARHSLLGAVEFRDVVRTLQQEALVDRSVEIYQSRDPERFLPHHHHHHQQHLSPDNTRQRPSRVGSRRGHNRAVSSLNVSRPNGEILGEGQNSRGPLQRSRSTTGPSASMTGSGANGSIRAYSMARRTQPSAFDATAVAAAVGDPWKEHAASDGCEQMVLPPPAQPISNEDETDDDTTRKPKLQIQLPSIDSDQTYIADDQDSRPSRSKSRRKSSSKRNMHHGESDQMSRLERIKITSMPTLKLLFPSLRHLLEKSWLGIAVGLITAPAILILNLTLPVVDDEGERAALSGEKILTINDLGQSPSGRIRLEGPEGDIYATTTRLNEDEDDDNIVGNQSADRNPWNQSDTEDDENRRGHLQVASTLQRLPHDSSPLAGTSPQRSGQTNGHKSSAEVLQDDAQSETDSCCSQDSHLGNTQSSHLFLVLAQCVLAPPFCVWSISTSADSSHVKIKTLIALFAGFALALISYLLLLRFRKLHDGDSIRSKIGIYIAIGWARVAAGFLVSILYIMTIVDEVVSILQTLGLILGLSDAILGLTVFAMGNSLGDLVANITIARMGHPVMAISACFAGPLLNLLLGIGISGTWLLSGHRVDTIPDQSLYYLSSQDENHRHGVYHIDFSPTLIVSGIGLLVILLGTLIAVPLNGFYLNKAIGLTLIITYAVIMTINVLVEIYFLE